MLKGFKTFILAMAVVLINGAEMFNWASIIPLDWLPLFNTLSGLVFVWLRKITNTPIFKK